MENKLKAITEQLYQEGLTQGREEGERILQQAKEEARKIVEDAQQQAAAILKKAEQEITDYRSNAETELKITVRQVVSQVKQSIENVILAQTIEPVVAGSLDDVKTVSTWISALIEKFDLEKTNPDLDVLLPKEKQTEFEQMLNAQIGGLLNKGVNLVFKDDIHRGFKVVSKDKGYKLSFSDEDFDALFKEYARPRIQKLLF